MLCKLRPVNSKCPKESDRNLWHACRGVFLTYLVDFQLYMFRSLIIATNGISTINVDSLYSANKNDIFYCSKMWNEANLWLDKKNPKARNSFLEQNILNIHGSSIYYQGIRTYTCYYKKKITELRERIRAIRMYGYTHFQHTQARSECYVTPANYKFFSSSLSLCAL